MRLVCALALALVSGCLAEHFAAPIATTPSAGASRIEIRERQPLSGTVGWIVDGVIYGWPEDSVRLNALKPDDIEKIDVIQGPMVSRLYPVFRCAAIVIVTTKGSTRERSPGALPSAPGCMIATSSIAQR